MRMVPYMALSRITTMMAAVLHGGRKLLAVHEEVAVARKDHHFTLGPAALAAHARRQAVAHRPTGGRQLARVGG